MLGREAAWFLAVSLGEKRSGGARFFDQFEAGAVFFSDLIDRDHGAAQRRQTPEFLLDFLESFMPLPVRLLVGGGIAFSLPVLLVLVPDLSDLSPQADDFPLEDS